MSEGRGGPATEGDVEPPGPTPGGDGDGAAVEDELADLAAELEVLRAENRRLRRAFDRARQVTYRRAAVGLGTVGAVGLVAAALLPALRTVLLVLGAIGVFSGLLTYYLTPERFVPASVGERVYAALAASRSSLVDELGLSDVRVYVPGDDGAGVRLFVPLFGDAPLPDPGALASALVVTDSAATRGLAFEPAGVGLHREYEEVRAVRTAEAPVDVVEGLVEAVVEAFELARSATADVDAADGRASVEVRGSAYGRLDRFDHPVVSFVGVGLADALGTPVTVESVDVDGTEDGAIVTYGWESSD